MMRTPGLLALFTAKLISTFGSWLTLLALPWFVLVTTGSPVRMSLVLTVEFLGVALLGLPSGKVVARLGVRRTMLICDAARAPLMALVPLLHLLGWLTLPALLAVSFGLGAFTTAYVSSQRLILPELLATPDPLLATPDPLHGTSEPLHATPDPLLATPNPLHGTSEPLLNAAGIDEALLARANSLVDAATRIAALAGPALGGLLIALLGAAQVLWIDAATYLVSFVILLLFVRPPASTTPPAHEPKTSVLAGLRHVTAHPSLRLFVLSLTLVSLSIPAIFICLPVLVLHDLGGDPRTLGLLTAANGAGLATGSLIAVTALSRMRTKALTGAAVLLCAPLWLLLTGNTLLLATALFLTGLAIPVLGATFNTRVTLRTPAPLRPHAMTAVANTENLAAFVGYTAAGPALQLTGTRPVFAAIATLATLGSATITNALRTDARNEATPTATTSAATTSTATTPVHPGPACSMPTTHSRS
ncbi:hypothetical protein GCM10010435_77680 [Winogradskya consettensis]|uniref:MFS transporter n=1 Tax=Winogradskya consettensis TaxID=113560 RepID=A0A919VTF5_9ACTN|nr:MFS transporter [Actinoplanes consettensis]GIM74755.1 hypothetical protein Aco04nite_41890 [Actinoplanes consettensis]